MAVNLSPVGGVAGQFFDNNGNPLSGGKVFTYSAGTTSTAPTYTTSAGTTPHTNPIVLDAAGRVPGGEIWLTDAHQYKFVTKTSTDVLIGTYDNILGINSNFVNFTSSQEIQTATAGQTVFTLTTLQYQPGTNSLSVFVDGINQYGPGAQYAYQETSSTVVTFNTGLTLGAKVKFVSSVVNSSSYGDAGQINYTPPFVSSTASNVETKLSQTISVKDFGAVGNGTVDDTTAILNALAALTNGGALYFPTGTYKFSRGTGVLIADTISANNVLIYGDGASSKIVGYSAAGILPNNAGNEFYNVFQATSRSNITVRNLAFEGYTTPVAMFSCTNVVIDNIYDQALLANTGTYLRNKSVYIYKCADVRIVNSRFENFEFGVYVSGDAGTLSSRVIVSSCSFDHTVAAGGYTSLFPVGVYWYFSDSCIVNGCTFKNIYSSLDNGTTGTGIGYGVYEGDGVSTSGVISSNTFVYEAKGNKNAIGVYVNEMQECSISSNTFYVASGGRMVAGMWLDAKNQDTKYSIVGNSFDIKSTAVLGYSVYVTGTSNYAPIITVSGNVMSGGANAVRMDGLSNAKLTVANNAIASTTQASIQLAGVSTTTPIKHPVISNNLITKSGRNAILLSQYIISPIIIGNTLLDGNTTNQAGDAGAAIFFTSFSYGSYIANNVIGNTAYGGGLFTYGAQNVTNATDRIFKDVSANNTFVGLANNNQLGRFWAASPTNGIFDANKGDVFQNVQTDAGDAPGWFCVTKLVSTLAADASSASTTVTVGSTSGTQAGDIVLLVKSSDPYAGDYADTTKWHIDTVASVTNPTQFVLTTGIPVTDGTYLNGVAVCHFARFKAAATIAV